MRKSIDIHLEVIPFSQIPAQQQPALRVWLHDFGVKKIRNTDGVVVQGVSSEDYEYWFENHYIMPRYSSLDDQL